MWRVSGRSPGNLVPKLSFWPRSPLFVVFSYAAAKKGSAGKSKEELTLEKRRELERRLQDVSGQLNSVKKPTKPKGGLKHPHFTPHFILGCKKSDGFLFVFHKNISQDALLFLLRLLFVSTRCILNLFSAYSLFSLQWKSPAPWRLTRSPHASAAAAPAQTHLPPPPPPLPRTPVIQTLVEILCTVFERENTDNSGTWAGPGRNTPWNSSGLRY